MTTRMPLHLYILLLHCLKTSLQNPKQMNSAPLIYNDIASENRYLVHAGRDHAHYIIAIFYHIHCKAKSSSSDATELDSIVSYHVPFSVVLLSFKR